MLELNLNENVLDEIKTVSSKDVAIIGIDVRLPMANNVDEFWNNLKTGKDCVGDLPFNRKKDIEDYLYYRNGTDVKVQYANGGYLKAIDKFDNEFFKISNKEANLMDPCQRIFLETAWKAIEDSGYGSGKLIGSRTGVYVGFTPRGEYRKFITDIEPESLTVAEVGNLSSIVAARIAYLLDFRGPSMIVNTECSSSLVAVHLACQSLRSGECDLAIAGGVRLAFSPVITDQKLGIESDKGKVCTFDDDSDGAVFGEGSVAIILKPLEKAVKDRDNIFAVMKGSAVNQDGASVGITAPNLLAQEDVIINAWKDSDINPETISYIEAHGTGTKLGDPIEVSGINRAFRRYTGKKQFCGVGSVKTNIAHLDNVAGIVSLVKVILALKNKKIPPSINFRTPNRKISFEDSAVYINNRLTEWETGETPRRCGVSSFGLSGTNCHIVLEEAPDINENIHSDECSLEVFTVSAMQKEIGMSIVKAMKERIVKDKSMNFGNICYTANTGRGHYNFRISIIAESKDELIASLEKICDLGIENVQDPNIIWGEHYVIPNNKQVPYRNEIYESQIKELNKSADSIIKSIASNGSLLRYDTLIELCRKYVKGAVIDWGEIYINRNYTKVSLPTYLFEEKRCWLTIPAGSKKKQISLGQTTNSSYNHPLIDQFIVESVTQDIYITDFRVDRHWVLKEHNIIGKYLVPGTAYLEMARECGSKYFEGKNLEFKNVVFLNSLVVDEGESKQIQTIIKKNEGYLEFIIAGREDNVDFVDRKWTIYCEGKMFALNDKSSNADFSALKSKCIEKVELNKGNIEQGINKDFLFGPRWTRVTQAIYVGNEEVFAELKLPQEYLEDLNKYYLHPSMLDMAVNAITQSTGNGIYLPLSYDSFKVYGPTTDNLYSYVKRTKSSKNLETMSFDVYLFGSDRSLVAEVNNLTTKKVHQEGHNRKESNVFYRIDYTTEVEKVSESYYTKESVMVFGGDSEISDNIITSLKSSGRRVVEVKLGSYYGKEREDYYTIRNTPEDYIWLFNEIKGMHIEQIVHLLTAGCKECDINLAKLDEYQEIGVYSLFNIIKAFTSCQITDIIDFVVVSDNVYHVDQSQTKVNAQNATLTGLCKVVNKEYSNIKCRVMDIDEFTKGETVTEEINSVTKLLYTAYRCGKRYIEVLNKAEIQVNNSLSDNLKDNGAYIITGGFGGLGIQVAKCLSEIKKTNIVLLGRRGLPQFVDWAELFDENNKNLSDNIAVIQQIIQSGSSVKYYSCDVSDAVQLENILNTVRTQYGKINGLIHAAGVAGDGYIINKTLDSFKKVLLPKVYGTYLLDKLTENDDLDFFVNFSSISSLYGYPGQSDYVAANSYLDSFSGFRRLKNKKTISINWAPWRETGMAYDYNLKDDGIFKMLPTKVALEAFKLALTSDMENIIIGSLNAVAVADVAAQIPYKLSEEIRVEFENKELVKRNVKNDKNKEADISIKGKSNNDYSQSELTLAQIWGNALGMSNVDIYANFMELGGDSILAVELLKEIEKVYSGVVSVSDIFSYPSVSEMANFIDSKINHGKKELHKPTSSGSKSNDIMSILGQLEEGKISISEAESMLSN